MITKFKDFILESVKYVPITDLKTEKEIVLVDTKKVHDILYQHSKGKIPLDKLRVNTMVKKLKDGGVLPPITVDENNMVIDGHHRYEAYKLAGMNEIPVEYK